MPRQYWLLKSEPTTFSIQDLAKSPHQRTMWEGVRNYQARNFLRDDLKIGDGILFYHSVTPPVGIAGLAEVVKEGYPDPTQFDTKSKYFDSKATLEKPRWFVVDIQLQKTFKSVLELGLLRELPGLEGMELLRKGSRLSVQPVRPEEWKIIQKLGK